MNTLNFTVTGMTCVHCERSVREEIEELGAIDSITVSAEHGTLTVTAAPEITAAAIIAAVAEAGYTATKA